MKRSKKVELTSIMLATAVTVGACDNIDDRTRQSNMEDKPYQYNVPSKQQKFNYEDEKKLRIDCNKPEDFSLSECHKPQNQQAQTQSRTHTSGFIFMPWFMPGYGGSAGGSYGPSTSTARNYSSARSAVNTPGLASTYRAATVNPNAFKGSYFGGTVAAKSTAATTVTRGGFGGTGRSIAVSSAARAGSVSAGG